MMIDKDPKDMTASELVRWVENYTDIMCRACREMGFGCDAAEVGDCEKALDFIADKIDAELSQARTDALNASLRSGAELWAKANGWPDFREGEDFGAWLDRCFLPRPRFEDGEPVQLGDRVLAWGEDHTVERIGIEVSGGGCLLLKYIDSPEERLERPAPEALGADGKPIVEGETVWLDEAHSRCAGSCGFEDGNKYSLCGIERQEMLTVEDAHIEVDGREYVRVCTCGAWCHASWLTHTPPDTQERIDGDITLSPIEYCADILKLPNFDVMNYSGFVEAMMRDLLRRQRELDKRTGGD